MVRKLINIIIVLVSIFSYVELLAYEPCDTLRGCVGRALKFTVSSGKGAHYVDVINNNLINKIGQGLTFELWIKPKKQANKTQFVGGLWGPNNEVNDSWVVYISPNDSVYFRLNGNNVGLGIEDETTVKTFIGDSYDKWSHFAFVFDGKVNKAYIFKNGNLIDSAINYSYPLNRIRRINNPELSIQLGSTNAISNDFDNYRTFLGDMDEIRIWGRALKPTEIYCNHQKALVGNEDSLLLYYRCNDPDYIFNLCDASGHKNIGLMRSGLKFGSSDRKDQVKVLISPTSITDTIICDTEKLYSFILRDTSVCGGGAYIGKHQNFSEKIRFIYKGKEYSQTWIYIPLKSNIPDTFQVKVISDFVGNISTTIYARNVNSCGNFIANINFSITRQTELSLNKLKIDYDSLKAFCIERRYIDSTIKICNNTDKSSNPKNITISNLSVKMPAVFQIISAPLPINLAPGQCIDITVRFNSRDSTNEYFDTLNIVSNDKCAPITKIPLKGKVKDVLRILISGTNIRLDSINFGKTCVNYPSVAEEYEWMNLDNKDITITNVIIPQYFYGKSFKFPIILKPNTGYQPSYFRFLPKQVGNFIDTIVIEAKSGNCTIRRPIIVKGKAYDAEISFVNSIVDFGNIKVGQELTLSVPVKNSSSEQLTASVYVKKGDPFFLSSSRNIAIPDNAANNILLTFRPSNVGQFTDELCIYENSCYQSFCIKVTGNAYLDRFSYEPLVLNINNVLGCQYKDSTLKIINTSSDTQILSNFSLVQQAGKFSLISPPNFPTNITLNSGESISFTVRYQPNDLTQERADKALIKYKTQDGQEWSAKISGNSSLPKIYQTEEILFETLEIGGIKQDTVIIENISSFDIQIESYIIPEGFQLIYPNNLSGRILKARDTIMVLINFVPLEDKFYQGEFRIFIKNPCEATFATKLSGRGLIVPLDAPLKVISYGFIRPCDCEERKIPLINNSFYFPMNIDSILIDSTNVTNPTPQFYSWYSYYSPNGIFPYQIPKRSTDTLTIRYCPRNQLVTKFVDNNARLNIYASGNGWNRYYTTFLAGKQTLLFTYDTLMVNFPPTRVDTVSAPQYVRLFIPDFEFNPQKTKIQITGLDFEPSERVFFASDSLGRPLELILDTNNYISLKLEFKPRAVRYYENKLKVIISTPCQHFDTTVVLTGSGFAPAFGLNFNFDNNRKLKDTLKFINCDTLAVPIYSSRSLPADVADIKFRLGYDTSKLEFLYADSDYLRIQCKNYKTYIEHKYSQWGGSEFLLKNACYVDSLKPILITYYKPKTIDRDTFELTLDSIKFDTEEVILYNIIAEPDFATIVILKPEITALNSVNFDSVKVLDCNRRIIKIVNTGDVTISKFLLENFTKEVKLVSTRPNLDDSLKIGDTLEIEIEYCPRKAGYVNGNIRTFSLEPCLVIDSNLYEGIGYAPILETGFDVTTNFNLIDTVIVQLGDTVTIPIYNEKDFSSIINGVEYWIEKLNFQCNLEYNPFNLEFIEAKNFTKSDFSYNYTPGQVVMNFKNTDTLRAGKISELKFISTIPDTNISNLFVKASNFITDSIMFLDIRPKDNSSVLLSLGRCGIYSLNYTGYLPNILKNNPNPWSEFTEISFTISEKTTVELSIFSIDGQIVSKVINNKIFEPGNYNVIISSKNFNSGVYYYSIKTNTFYDIKKMIVIK